MNRFLHTIRGVFSSIFPKGSRVRPTGSQGVKGRPKWSRGSRGRPAGSQDFKGPSGSQRSKGGQRCPIGSTATFGDPMGPSGWFDESADDSLGICARI